MWGRIERGADAALSILAVVGVAAVLLFLCAIPGAAAL